MATPADTLTELSRSARISSSAQLSSSTRGASSGLNRYFCAFWLGGQLYAIDVGYVGEVISIQESIRVPLAPFAVAGMCAVRGTALAIIDLAMLLDLPTASFVQAGSEGGPAKGQRALVLRGGQSVAAAPIERVEAVQRFSQAALKHAPGPPGSPVLGILELTHRGSGRATLLDGASIIERIGRKSRA